MDGRTKGQVVGISPDAETERTRILNWWAMIRWFMLVVLFAIGLLHLSEDRKMVDSFIFYGGFFGVFILNVLFQVQSKYRTHWVTVFQIVLDILFATYVVHFTGGLASSFVWIYLLGIITAALTIPKTGGFMAGLIGSLALLMLIILYQNGILHPIQTSNSDMSSMLTYILSYTGLFCGVAMIANFLSDLLAQKSSDTGLIEQERQKINELYEKLEEARVKLDQMRDLNPILIDIAELDHDLNTPLCVISLSLSRVTRLGIELGDEGLKKSGNEITDALNRINHMLLRLDALKKTDYIKQIRGH